MPESNERVDNASHEPDSGACADSGRGLSRRFGLRHPLIGVALSLICLVMALRGVQWAELRRVLMDASPVPFACFVVLAVVILMLRSIRWNVLLMSHRRGATWTRSFAALSIGYFANNILPARAGELVRAVIWTEWTGAPTAAVLSTIGLEHLVDLLCLFVCLLALIPLIDLPVWVVRTGLTAGGAVLACIILLTVIAGKKWLILRPAERLENRFRFLRRFGLQSLMSSLLDGLMVLRSRNRCGLLLFWSVVIWSVQVFSVHLMMVSLHLPVPLAGALAILVFTSLGSAVPSTPGQIGIFHYCMVWSLGLFGMDPSAAFGSALFLHGSSYVVVSLTGLFFIWRTSLSWSRVRTLLKKGREPA